MSYCLCYMPNNGKNRCQDSDLYIVVAKDSFVTQKLAVGARNGGRRQNKKEEAAESRI